MNRLLHLIALTLLTFWHAAVAADSALKPELKSAALNISVSNAFFYVPLRNAKTTMAFFTIINNSTVNVQTTGISSPAAQLVQFMPDTSLLLPAKQSVALTASGRYVQITNLNRRLTTGDELQLEVSLSNGQRLHIIAVAKSAFDQLHGR